MRPLIEAKCSYIFLAPTNWRQLIFQYEGTVETRLTPMNQTPTIMSSIHIIRCYYGPNYFQNRGMAQGTRTLSPSTISSITRSEIIPSQRKRYIIGHCYSSQVQNSKCEVQYINVNDNACGGRLRSTRSNTQLYKQHANLCSSI